MRGGPSFPVNYAKTPIPPPLNVKSHFTLAPHSVKGYFTTMDIESISHKGLRRFFETGNPKGLVGDVDRIRKMLAFINAAGSLDELSTPPNYGMHALSGDRAGTWSMMVTKNWRLTFCVNKDGAIVDMDLEDYHGS